MSPERFENLLGFVGPLLLKKHCRSRKPIGPAERLMITLRYLASGESQQSLSFAFRVGKATVCKIVREGCVALWEALNATFLTHPKTTADWVNHGEEFYQEWAVPNCLGALDGKHISTEFPQNAGSAFFNYKNCHSLVLMAICDARYCFTFVNIGSYGGENDSSVFQQSEFGRAFDQIPTKFGIPAGSNYGGRTLPYVLIGDDIFPLKPWLIKPYPGKKLQEEQRVYNYRLSRARRTIENAFGILAARWRIFRRPIKANVDLVYNITRACLCLHNYLRLTENASYIPSGFIDSEDSSGIIIPGSWRNVVREDNISLTNHPKIGGNRYTFEAEKTQKSFKDYFNSEAGSVPWQLNYVRSCGLVHVSN